MQCFITRWNTEKRELKIRRAAEYFWRISRCSIWWRNTVPNAWYYSSNKMILRGEIKDAKMRRFSSDFQTLIKRLFPLYFLYDLLMNLRRRVAYTEKQMKHMAASWRVPCLLSPEVKYGPNHQIIRSYHRKNGKKCFEQLQLFHSVWYSSQCLNFGKFCDTAPLSGNFWTPP